LYFSAFKAIFAVVNCKYQFDLNKIIMDNLKIEKISEIIAFVISIFNGEIDSKTKLVKLLYLIDVVFARKYKKTFSGISYKSYYYGPYSEDIEKALKLLQDFKYLTVEAYQGLDGTNYYRFKLNSMPSFNALTEVERSEVKNIVPPFVLMPLKDIIQVAYNTKEYKQTDFNNIIQLGNN
jgi:uncharacterized protein YwgA